MNIHTVFAHRPAFRTVVQLKRPLDISAPTSQLVKLRHVGVGFAPPANPSGVITTWDYYVTNWTTPPTQAGTTAAGAVYSYTLTGVTRHRLVPSPYVAAQDAFYSAWDGAVLSGLIVSRG